MIANRCRAMVVAVLLLACSAARAGERDRLGTVRECWAAIRALPDSRTVASTGDPAWRAYKSILDSPYCSAGAVVLAHKLLIEHPELTQ